MLDICFELIRRAVDVYFSDATDLRLTSADPWLALASADANVTQVAVRLLMSDFPSPFAGGGYGPGASWALGINGGMARRFRDVESLDDYFSRQAELQTESQKDLAMLGPVLTASGAPRAGPHGDGSDGSYAPTIFVVMPFSERWSTGVSDFIRRAVRSLGYSDARVFRADDITKPGRINEQIIEAIESAEVVVGDITNTNANVMWELGYAEAARIPSVVLNQHIDESPFDLQNVRQVSYSLAPTDEEEKKVADHIRAALDERWSSLGSGDA